ncbi:MAG: hypothetical protein NTW80_09600, partial [Deltaproteobacteria bacterium]|nr:hypothetical protein [Deltaproteobacteria bacterium]
MPDSVISEAEVLYLLELTEMAFRAQDLAELAESFLRGLARLKQTAAAVLYLEDPHLPGHAFFQTGLPAEVVPLVRSQCAVQFHPEPGKANLQPVAVSLGPLAEAQLSLFPLRGPQK